MEGSLPVQNRWELYKVLSEPMRLRLLAVASEEELAVGELAELMQESQPNISRHLALLRRLGLLSERREGTRVFVRLAGQAAEDPVVSDAIQSGHGLCQQEHVLERVAALVAKRDAPAREFFGRSGQLPDDNARFPAELPAYLSLLAPLIPSRGLAVDAGTGDGRLLEVLAPLYDRVIGLDRETAQLERAADRLHIRGYRNVQLRHADLSDPDFAAAAGCVGQADAVFATRVLHHTPRPAAAFHKLAALLKPGGVVLVLDYQPHQDESLREAQADLWLGFPEAELLSYAHRAGLTQAHVRPIPPSLCGGGPDGHLGWHMLFARRAHVTRDQTPTELDGDESDG